MSEIFCPLEIEGAHDTIVIIIGVESIKSVYSCGHGNEIN